MIVVSMTYTCKINFAEIYAESFGIFYEHVGCSLVHEDLLAVGFDEQGKPPLRIALNCFRLVVNEKCDLH